MSVASTPAGLPIALGAFVLAERTVAAGFAPRRAAADFLSLVSTELDFAAPVFVAAPDFNAPDLTALVFTTLVLAALARAAAATFDPPDFALEAAAFVAAVRDDSALAELFLVSVRARAEAVREEAALFAAAGFAAALLPTPEPLPTPEFLLAPALLPAFLPAFLAEMGFFVPLAGEEEARAAAARAVFARVSLVVAPRFLLEADASRLFAVFLSEGIRGYSLLLSRFGDGTCCPALETGRKPHDRGTTPRPGLDGALDRAQIG